MADPDNKPFLSRWSRRKQAARDAEATAPDPGAPPAQGDAAETALADPEVEAARQARLQANREAAEAVDLETLDETSDVSVFMKDGVPAALRRRAMAMLWRSNPVFANVDGLVDYDDDFANPGLVTKALKSAWQVGRGYRTEGDEAVTDSETAGAGEGPEERLVEADTDDAVTGSEAGSPQTATTEPDVDKADAVQPPDAEGAPTHSLPEPTETADFEPDPVPRVSLRRRLMLDGGA